MQHRHLLPNEVDLLLDGDVGFGVAPLRAHADDCAECRDRVAEARAVADALDALPRFAPGPSFANRVMAHVQVVEPLHVALTAAVRRLVPRTRAMRLVMAASAGLAATTISSALVWLSFRADVAMYLAALADERLRAAAAAGLGGFAHTVLGAGAVDAVTTQGPSAIAVGAGVLVGAVVCAAYGLRRVALAARRAKE